MMSIPLLPLILTAPDRWMGSSFVSTSKSASGWSRSSSVPNLTVNSARWQEWGAVGYQHFAQVGPLTTSHLEISVTRSRGPVALDTCLIREGGTRTE